jgi:hypothetical protein
LRERRNSKELWKTVEKTDALRTKHAYVTTARKRREEKIPTHASHEWGTHIEGKRRGHSTQSSGLLTLVQRLPRLSARMEEKEARQWHWTGQNVRR